MKWRQVVLLRRLQIGAAKSQKERKELRRLQTETEKQR